jgi:hypothetical protein
MLFSFSGFLDFAVVSIVLLAGRPPLLAMVMMQALCKFLDVTGIDCCALREM